MSRPYSRANLFEYGSLFTSERRRAMSMTNWRAMLWAATVLTFPGPGFAAETTTFDTCIDAAGHTLPADADYRQTMLVQTIDVQGQPEIRYNPGVLPRLTFAARLFLYAHQCARQGMGAVLTVAQAQRADCIGLNTLLTSDMLKREDLPAIQDQLKFSNAEWELLPGPPRTFDLGNCRQTTTIRNDALRLPSKALPSEQQTAWNNCARACADRLWACQKRCGGSSCEGCLEAHRQCKSACGGTEKPAD